MEELSGESSENTTHIKPNTGARRIFPMWQCPICGTRTWITNEAAPGHKEAQGGALHYNRAFRDASVALAPVVVSEDFVNLLLSQFLHILYNGGYLIGLISGTAQFKEG